MDCDEDLEAKLKLIWNSPRNLEEQGIVIIDGKRETIPITIATLKSLKPRVWLNAEVVDAYLEIILRKHPDITLFTSYFSITVKRESHEKILEMYKRRFNKMKESSEKLVLIPLLADGHWTLLYLDIGQQESMFFDSYLGKNKEVVGKIMRIFKDAGIITEELKIYYPVRDLREIPKQKDGYNCGVIVIMYAEETLHNKDIQNFMDQKYQAFSWDTEEENMNQKRILIGMKILESGRKYENKISSSSEIDSEDDEIEILPEIKSNLEACQDEDEDRIENENKERENEEKFVSEMEVEEDDKTCQPLPSSGSSEEGVGVENKELSKEYKPSEEGVGVENKELSKEYKLPSPEKTKMKIYRGKKSRNKSYLKYYSRYNPSY